MLKHISHGEVNLFEISKLPERLNQIEVSNDFLVVGESETHGNDHRITIKDKDQVVFFERNGVLYMKNLVETEIYCPKENRHDTIIIPPSLWEIRKAQEYDYLEQELRPVKD